eukprot:Ihof_evm10s168 gene=Ihof_evmTU10s168
MDSHLVLRRRLQTQNKIEEKNAYLLDVDVEDGKRHSLPFPVNKQRPEVSIPEPEKNKQIYLKPQQRKTLLGILTLLAFMTRLYRLSEPHSIVFDEVHFGGFASKYITGIYFFDVHPPTGKLLYALVGWLAGYDGTFSFAEIHMDYIKDHVPYVAMRLLPATCGAMLVPLAFSTVHGMGYSVLGATLAACMVLFEN